MVKGCQKRMIMLRTRESGLFEEAYFILRPEKTAATETLMIAEANRIIEENVLRANRPRLNRAVRGATERRLLWFLCGCAAGGALTALLCLLF